MPTIDVQRASDMVELPDDDAIRAWASAALCGEKADWEAVVRIVDEDEGRTLNGQFRDRDYPTNVLSFPYEELPGMDSRYLGDLVICAPVVAREASEQGKALSAHWAHMLVHGMLHLQGYDHQNDADAEEMEAREREILAGLGIADPYAVR